jgi:Fe-Mn family superoxide dismutase
MTYKLPKLTYDYKALEPFIDAKTMEIHHNKHHAGYVNKLNAALADYPKYGKKRVEKLVRDLNKLPASIRTSVRNNGGGHANHSLFWKIMAPVSLGGGKMPDGKLMEAIEKQYTSFNNLKEKMTNAALGRFGSGWAWLTVDKNKLKIESTANQDSPLTAGRVPILGIDVWEHAYYLKYQNKRADYVNAFWNIVNWKQVEKNFSKA